MVSSKRPTDRMIERAQRITETLDCSMPKEFTFDAYLEFCLVNEDAFLTILNAQKES